jgi:hypothetical protein
MINDLAFACAEHKSMLIALRRMLDRDRAEPERRRHSWKWARAGHPPLPIKPSRYRRCRTPPRRAGLTDKLL